MNTKLFLNLLLFSLLISSEPIFANPIGVAAIVQGEKIEEAMLQKSIDAYLQQQGTNVGAIRNPKRFKEVRKKVLDVLIGQTLLWQAAVNDKTTVEDEAIDKAYEEFMASFDSKMMFDMKLKESGYSEETFRENLRQRLSSQKWLQIFVLNQLSVNDDEVHDFYLKNQQQLSEPEQVRARHILIQVKPDAGNDEMEQAKSLLSQIKEEIRLGASFASMAKEKSQDASAPQGGDLGYFQRGQMVPPFEQAAFNLAPGEISDIVQTRFGLHLIMLEDRKAAVQYEEKAVAEKIRAFLLQDKTQQAIENAVADLKQNAVIEISAF